VVIIKVLSTLLGFTTYNITLRIATCINHIGYYQAIGFTVTMMKITDMAETCYHYYNTVYCDTATSTIW